MRFGEHFTYMKKRACIYLVGGTSHFVSTVTRLSDSSYYRSLEKTGVAGFWPSLALFGLFWPLPKTKVAMQCPRCAWLCMPSFIKIGPLVRPWKSGHTNRHASALFNRYRLLLKKPSLKGYLYKRIWGWLRQRFRVSLVKFLSLLSVGDVQWRRVKHTSTLLGLCTTFIYLCHRNINRERRSNVVAVKRGLPY